MDQFTKDYIRKFKYYQLQVMMRQVRAPRHMGHEPVEKMKQWLEDYAKQGEQTNQAVWGAYHAVKGDTVKPVAEPSSAAMTPEQLNEVLKSLAGSLRDDLAQQLSAQAKEALAQAAKSYRQVEVVAPSAKPKKMKGVMPAVFDRVLRLASQRVNVMLVGPAGCGKTFIGGKIAEALDMPFSSISCSAGMSESQLAGWLLPVGTGGKFEYVPAPFIERYEEGGVFLLDEIDGGDSNTLTFLNKAIANDGFYVPQRRGKTFVKKHKDFVCLAAANTFGHGADAMYVGRNQLDAATLDRFRAGMVMMDYDDGVESALVHPEVLTWGCKLRTIIKEHRMRRIMSTRLMLDLTKMVESYKWGQEEWERSYFADWTPDEIQRVKQAA